MLFTIVRIELERSSRSIALTVLTYLAHKETVAGTPWITLSVRLTCQCIHCTWSSFPLVKDSPILLTDVVNSHTILRQCALSILVIYEEFNLVAILIYIATRSRRTGIYATIVECTVALACTSEELGEWLGHISGVSDKDTRVAISPVSYVEVTLAVDRHTGWIAELSDTALVLLSVELIVSIVVLPYTTVRCQ